MNTLYLKLSNTLLILSAFLFLMTSPISATVEVIKSSSQRTILPRGEVGAVFYIQVQQQGAPDSPSETITSLELRNDAEFIRFGTTGVEEVTVFEDIDNNETFESTDSSVGSKVFSSGINTQETISISTITLSETKKTVGLFIVYRISGSAPIGETTKVQVVDINNQDTIPFNDNTTNSEITISGFKVFEVANKLTPNFAAPSDENERIGMLSVQITPEGESLVSPLTITIENQDANFVTDNATNGVVGVSIYEVAEGNETQLEEWHPTQFNSSFQRALSTDDTFVSSSEIQLKVLESLSVSTTFNMIILYDLGEDITVGEDTKVSAKITNISATGASSGLPVSGPNDDHSSGSTVGEVDVAGISFSNLSKAPVLDDDTLNFGKEQIVPILSFTLQSHKTTSNVKSITIENEQEVGFRTISSDPTNIIQIDLFEDTDASGDFAGINSTNDTKVGSLVLGSGNQKTKAVIPLDTDADNDMLAIDPFNKTADYPGNNEKILFAVYYTGKQVSPINGVTEALLGNVRADIQDPFDDLNTIEIQLSGEKPAAADPNAEFPVLDTTVYIKSITNIAPSAARRGSSQIAMLKIILEASETYSEAQITVRNRENSFTPFDTGVNQVWLFHDDAPTSDAVDDSVTQVTSVSNIASLSEVTFTNVGLNIGENHFFVLYDLGEKADAPFSAQLITVQNDPDQEPFSFGGELPNPTNPTQVTITEHLLEISSVSVTDFNDDALSLINESTGTFNIKIIAKNTSTSTVEIQEVAPKVFKNLIGEDITSEFSIQKTNPVNQVTSLKAGEESAFNFEMSHSRLISEGNARFDGTLTYKDPDNTSAFPTIKRFVESNVTKSAANNVIDLRLIGLETNYDWSLPAYISKLELTRSDGSVIFGNGNTVKADDGIKISFTDSGKNVNLGTIIVLLNGVALSSQSVGDATSLAISDSYTLDSDNGTITIESLGDTSGSITVQVKDDLGNSLTDTVINFVISQSMAVSDLLFYPNPFVIGTENLKLGFNITQEATVDIYIYNFLGEQVFRKEHLASIGYNLVEIDSLHSFLSSGHYYCKIHARGSSGEDWAVTKLAIY